MKKLITIIFICWCVQSFAQTEWATIGAKWYYPYYSEEVAYPYECRYYVVEKDTIIDTVKCYGINEYYLKNNGITEKIESETIYTDSSCLFIHVNGKFVKLFDFSASAGDTIKVLNEKFNGFFEYKKDTYSCFEYIIDEIKDTIINNNQLTVQHIRPTEKADWVLDRNLIFKVGPLGPNPGTGTLFGFPKNITTWLGFGPLRCFINGNDVISLMNIPCDTVANGINSISNSIFTYSIINNQLLVDVPKISLYLAIFRLDGVPLFVEKLSTARTEKTSINIADLKAGMYILTIFTNKGIITNKFIIE